jgi:hypothetical protein
MEILLRPIEPLTKESLCSINADLLDENHSMFRDYQNWVGESFIAPKPDDVDNMMDGLLRMANSLVNDEHVDALVAAVAVAFGFIFVHPFRDGNGRTHRTLIHLILQRKKFYIGSAIIPFSQAMLADRLGYYRMLRYCLSDNVMALISYQLEMAEHMTVQTPVTHPWYRYFDATICLEYMNGITDMLIRRSMQAEADFLRAHSNTVSELVSLGISNAEVEDFLEVYLDKGSLSWNDQRRFRKVPLEQACKLAEELRRKKPSVYKE